MIKVNCQEELYKAIKERAKDAEIILFIEGEEYTDKSRLALKIANYMESHLSEKRK